MKKFILLFICALFTLSSCSRLPPRRIDKLSILQGVTNSREVEFSVVAKKGRDLVFELRDEEGKILSPEKRETLSQPFSDFVIHKILFERDPSTLYNLFVFEDKKIIDQRQVGMGPREESKLRLAVVSCMSDYYSEKFNIWDILSSKNPDYLLMIGDNVYADQDGPGSSVETDPKILWERYLDARLSYPFFFQSKLIPTHALWDDHDYGKNNSDQTFGFKKESKEIFDAFYAQALGEENWSKGHGVGGVLSLGDFNLYFLDARSFRSPDSSGTHLGREQTSWLYEKLKEGPTPSILIKGDQFFGGHHPFESYEGNHPRDFGTFVDELKTISAPYLFVSGDRHMSEIMQFPRSLFGKPSFEITSSPLHAHTFPSEGDKIRNPWRVVAKTGEVNFTIIDNLAQEDHWFLEVENIGPAGETFFRRELALYIKDLQDNLKEQRKRRSFKRRYRKLRSFKRK